MVGIVEGVLIVGALALDVYAYKKMKDAEEVAERNHTTVNTRTTILSDTTNVTPAPAPVAASAGTTSTITTNTETHEEEQEWEKPPVTYAPLASEGSTAEEIRLLREDLKGDLSNLGERIEVLEERVRENQTSTEEKYQSIESRFESGVTPKVDEDKIAEGIAKKLAKRQGQLSKKMDDNYKKILEVENKVDSALISAPDTKLIKKDLREEFAPLLGLGKKIDDFQSRTESKLNSLSKKAFTDSEVLKSKIDFLKKRTSNRRVTFGGPKTAAVKTAAKKTAAKNPVTKTKKTRTIVRTTSAKKTSNKSGKDAEVTVTTEVPKGVQVSTEVVTGKKK